MNNQVQEQDKKPNQVRVLKKYLESPKVNMAIKKVLPKFLTFDKLLSFVMTEVRSIPKLLKCDHVSFTNCLIQCVQLGLIPGKFFGQAYLIPREIDGIMTCTLLPGYRGYVVLAERAGTSLTAQCYCENDIKYECMLGSFEQIIHIPANDNRGKIICAYAVAKNETILKDGSRKIITKIDHMSMSEIEKAKACSQCPTRFWKPWEHEMCRKTVALRLSKYLDLSKEFNQLREIDSNIGSGVALEGEFTSEEEKQNMPQNKKLLEQMKNKKSSVQDDIDKIFN